MEKKRIKQNNNARNRNKSISLRFTENEKNDFIELSNILNLSKTETLIYLVNEYKKNLKNKEVNNN